jgi:hypothetical protein
MKRWFLLTLILGLAVPGLAQLRVSPASITTGLRWDNVAGGLYSYSGTTLTVTGNPGAVTWTIKDQNGTAITTLSTRGGKTLGWPTTKETPPDPTAVFGQIDCTGSAANTACVYSAPGEYPPGETASLVASSGSSSASVSVTFTFAYNLEEYFKHRARMLGFQSKPVKTLEIADNPVRYQPELLVFQSGPLPGGANYEYQIVQDDNDVGGAGFPATAGSSINRPSWSYDGKWFSWIGYRCFPGSWCSAGDWNLVLQQSDGSNLQSLTYGGPVPYGFSYTYNYDRPDWLLTSDASQIYVVVMGKAMNRTSVATYSSSIRRTLYSPPSGAYAEFKEPNPASCSPISSHCSPNVYVYDLSACETHLAPGCATLSSQWNLNLNLNLGWTSDGKQHCTIDGGGSNCEYHVHDFYLRRNTTETVWNYGPAGDVGEGIFYKTSANGTGTVPLYPNAAQNVPYMSHPAFNGSGDLVAYGGQQSCTPSGNACTNNTWGEGIWGLRTNKPVAFRTGVAFAHAAWDGFDDNHFAHDGHGSGSCPVSHWCLQSSYVDYSAGTIQDSTVLDFGTRDRNKEGDHSFSLYFSPTQSPDATKLAQSMKTSFSIANQDLGWVAVVRKPSPPVGVSLASADSATLGWLGAPLKHETRAYHIYKQASCRGPWERLADVSAVYLQQTRYTYTDRSLASGQSACYGISSEEWTGTESDGLSAVLSITHAGGAFSARTVSEAGTTHFDTTPPATPSGLNASPVRLTAPDAPQSVVQTSGGSLPDGSYRVRLAYCNYSDFPANSAANARCTTAGPAQSGTIKGGNGTGALSITGRDSEAYGQVAVQVYACGPPPFGCPETLQATFVLAMPPNARPGQLIYTLKTLGAGAAPPTANQTLQGYSLKWTSPSESDVRYYALYSRDDAVPRLAGVDAYQAQQYLIATLPAGCTSYFDYTINWTRADSGAGGPYYGIVAVDREGNRSAPACLRADTGASVPCN